MPEVGRTGRVFPSDERPNMTGSDKRSLALGLIPPIVTRFTGPNSMAMAGWESQAGAAELATIARRADELGFCHITCAEHISLSPAYAATNGSTWWDSTATFGYLAAVTKRIRFLTHVLVLGLHHPLEIAKRYGTVDMVSGGRLMLGVGIGASTDELELFGVPLTERVARDEDQIRALRAIARAPLKATYDGAYFKFADLVIDPCISDQTPIWVGGRTFKSLVRATELADGWTPARLEPDELGAMLKRVAETPAWQARAKPLEVAAMFERPVDPMADPEDTRKLLQELRDAGADSGEFLVAFVAPLPRALS